MFTSIPSSGFLRLPQILAIFPKPVKLGPRTTVWRVEDITAFINQISGRVNSQQQEAGDER